MLADTQLVITPKPAAYFGSDAISRLPELVRAAGRASAVIVTDRALADTEVMTRVKSALAEGGIQVAVFDGVRPNPTTDDIDAGAALVRGTYITGTSTPRTDIRSTDIRSTTDIRGAQVTGINAGSAALVHRAGQPAIVPVGGGSAMDAAKGIALAAANPQRGRDLAYGTEFAHPALPLIAVPTTAGTGAETNDFGVITDTATRRKFYVGHTSALPRAAILDPRLTVGLPPPPTAASGMDALTHAIESYLSVRANPWSDGIALQVIKMVSAYLPRAYAEGTDLEARAQLLLAAHMAGVGMASTGLGICHGIGHPLGGRFDIAHGVALTMLLPHVLRYNLPVRPERTADIAFALGVGDTTASLSRNIDAAIDAIERLAGTVGITGRLAGFGVTEADFATLAADALEDAVMVNTPRPPEASDIHLILGAAL
jgi:alcohol dehydrogenase